jgi:hypothetical protein
LATRSGEIWHDRTTGMKRMKQRVGKRGYLQVGISRCGKASSRYAHRLVLEAWVGPCPDGMESRHLDGDKQNNRIGNLRWGTHEENIEDNYRLGRSTRIMDEFTFLPIRAQWKKMYRWRRDGLCITCGKPVEGSVCYCAKHLALVRAYQLKRKQARVQIGP